MNKILYLVYSLFLLTTHVSSLYAQKFTPGAIWKDTDGVHINAHGGGILLHDGTYYWYGTHMHENTAAALKGVGVYSSKNLYDWKNEGIALEVFPEGSGHKIESGCLIERPKVIFNEKTGKFVMWFHLELKGQGYKAEEYGVAISDSPVGPFKFLHAGRSCSGIIPMNMEASVVEKLSSSLNLKARTPEWRAAMKEGLFVVRDLGKGQMVRDMTIFVDDDGKAYHVFASEENNTLHLAELTDDYCGYTGKYVRVLPGRANEAPAIFKHKGQYWLIASGCTGWDPNPARMAVADDIWGPWKELDNPCVGDKANITFDSQSTFILPVPGTKNKWIFMADRWNSKNLKDSRYVWLPIEFEKGVPVLRWYDSWNY